MTTATARITGPDYDPNDRYQAAFEYALDHSADNSEALEFADNVGGDGGETTIAQAWKAWVRS